MQKPRILFEDATLVAVHKPAGFTVYPEAGAQTGDAQTYLKTHVKGLKAGNTVLPVHRLDRGTCGVVLFAKDVATAQKLKKQFLKRGVEKTYWAMVLGRPTSLSGSFSGSLKNREGKEESALTRFRLGESFEDEELGWVSWLILEPKTGRFHQIRKHLAAAGMPILGDATYGRKPVNEGVARRWKVERALLSAVELRLKHPQTLKELILQTDPDDDFLRVFNELDS